MKSESPGPKGKLNRHLLTLTEPRSFVSEQFNILRSKLATPCSVMVTSAAPGEGKSFVSANLAISIAKTVDKYALLVDSDLRSPSIHTVFGFQDGALPGLAEYLGKDFPLSSILAKTEVPKLTILPGGEPPENPAELISSEKMIGLLSELKKKYSDRYIIIDSPPPLLIAEARVIARHVDQIILVVKEGKTSKQLIDDLIDVIGKDKIIGAVMNHSEMRSTVYRHMKNYGKYYKYMKYK